MATTFTIPPILSDSTFRKLNLQLLNAILGQGGGVASNVAVTNFPATQTVNGSVSVAGNVEVTNDVGNPLPVNGTVEITNDVGNAIPISGTVVPTSSAGTLISGTVTGSVVILAAGSRKYLAIQNTSSSNPMYITTDGTTPSATNGFVLQPSGGGFVWENSWVPNGVITAYSTGTTSTLIWA